jgi:NO-binding membrane sensor protein with MHYT domain
METTVGRLLFVLVSVALAAVGASTTLQIAYDVFGLSRETIRVVAVMAALLVGALLVALHFGESLRKRKSGE